MLLFLQAGAENDNPLIDHQSTNSNIRAHQNFPSCSPIPSYYSLLEEKNPMMIFQKLYIQMGSNSNIEVLHLIYPSDSHNNFLPNSCFWLKNSFQKQPLISINMVATTVMPSPIFSRVHQDDYSSVAGKQGICRFDSSVASRLPT